MPFYFPAFFSALFCTLACFLPKEIKEIKKKITNKTIKDIQEDMKLLSSADGDVDTKKVNDRINQNIDKLENLSKDEKTKLKDNLNGVDNIVNNNIKGIQDAAKEMQDFIKNRSSRGEDNKNLVDVN